MISLVEFSALLERAGLELDENQSEAARQSYANLRLLTAMVRTPRNRSVEPSCSFRVFGSTTLIGEVIE